MRFSIRDLLWLTLVVAIGLGWLVRELNGKEALWRDRAADWKATADALENALNTDGWGAERKGHYLRIYPLSDSRLMRGTEHSFLLTFPGE